MCGIVGYIGPREASAVLSDGLGKLEYRGYDSAGVAIFGASGIMVRKRVGKLKALTSSLSDEPLPGRVGIGHTRWATHGEPTENNSHPHQDMGGTVFVVHNGIVENYAELRKGLEAEGITFQSETDTEVIPNLIARAYCQNGSDLPQAVRAALAQLRGTYAVAVLHRDYPDTLIAARLTSPLVIGLGEAENIVASDLPAVLSVTNRVIFLEDGELAVVSRQGVEIQDVATGATLDKSVETVNWSVEEAEKGGHAHFMHKEIHEQPEVIERLLTRYTSPERDKINLDQLGLSEDELRRVKRVFIQACGTSWHSGLVGKLLIERLALVPVEVDTSSEFRYRNAVPHARGAILPADTLVLAISQSGETVDTLAGIREARSRGLKVVSLVNVPGSTITRESDGVIYLNAGPEISVASTKAYTAQLAALYLFALHLGMVKGVVDERRLQRRLGKLAQVPELMREILTQEKPLQEVADQLAKAEHALFIGRGFGYPSALEGALKLKEISYIHAEGYSAGELKHGPLALIDDQMPVIAIATPGVTYDKMLSNIQEVRARHGRVIAIVETGNDEVERYAERSIYLPGLTESFSPLLVALPLQLLAYYTALRRGHDVDQPRNLAKSVTVE